MDRTIAHDFLVAYKNVLVVNIKYKDLLNNRHYFIAITPKVTP